jgi:hypothetical protein
LAVEWLTRVPSADHLSPWSECLFIFLLLLSSSTGEVSCDCEYVTTHRTHLFLVDLILPPPPPLGPIVNIICNVTNFKSIYEMKLWEHQLQMRSLQIAYLEIFRDFPEDIIINENKLGIFWEVNLELQNLHSNNFGIIFLWRSFA